ncbi:hypothetical protein H5410_032114 [Solanum commersonii]|uniref:Uncharacterized protein n=1 Tax=Solanum commersonii TaxID=4109 RepID=A0A9J5YM18_SOLCO|nr:hypothetical protein H5410_032114 [Solanum commersonii]
MVIISEYNEQDDKPPSLSPVSPKPSNETKVEEAINATEAIEEDKKGNGLDLDNYSCGQIVQEVREANNTTEAIEENKKGLLAEDLCGFHLHCANLLREGRCWGFLLLSHLFVAGLGLLTFYVIRRLTLIAFSADMYTTPNIGNGLDLDNYSWDQSIHKVKEAINTTEAIEENKKGLLVWNLIAEDLCGFYLHCANLLREGRRCGFLLLSPLFVAGLEDQKSIYVLLTKIDKMNRWKWVVKGEPKLDIEKVEPEITRLSELDPEIQSSVETIMFDQQQETMGLPALYEMQN